MPGFVLNAGDIAMIKSSSPCSYAPSIYFSRGDR